MELPRFKLGRKTTLLTPLFLNESARAVAVSFLSFFSIIYIYRKIFELTSDQVLAFIIAFGFFAVLDVFKMMGIFLAENLALRIGLKKQVVIGNVLTMVTLLAFCLSEKNLLFLSLAAVLWGLAIGFFWFGRDGLLAKTGEDGEYGEALGWAGIIDSVFVLGVPFLGGVLITRLGYQALFLVSLLFISLGLIPLFSLKDKKTHRDTTVVEVTKLLFSHKRMSFAYFALGASGSIYSLALLLYIFLFLGQELSFGGFFSLSLLLVAVINFLIGKWTDEKGKKGLVSYGAFLTFLVWLGRFFVIGAPILLILDVIDRITESMVGIPMMVLTYEKALGGHVTSRALIFRETALTLGSVFVTLLLMVMVYFGFPLKFSFLVAAILMLAPLLIVEKGLPEPEKK